MNEGKVRKPVKTYMLLRILAAVLFHTLSPIVYFHQERLPKEAPYLLISNHFSNMDPIIVGYTVKKHEIVYLGKKELVSNRLIGAFMRHMRMIPISRGGTDMEAMRACMKALKSGEVLGVFPEGTRHHKGIMEEIMDGFAFMAMRSGVPLVPILIEKKWRLFSVNHVVIGETIPYEDLREDGINRENCEKLIARVRESYARMQEELRSK